MNFPTRDAVVADADFSAAQLKISNRITICAVRNCYYSRISGGQEVVLVLKEGKVLPFSCEKRSM